ncbi:MAG: glycosyltransferase family 4 protein [Balneolales bacterium]
MRVLFLTDNFPPEVNAPATRTFEHCKHWVDQGAQVTVITGFPNFPQGKVYEGYKNQRVQKEQIQGMEVIRVWTFIHANKGFFRRTADYLSFALSSFFAGLFQKPDIIVATSPQFFTTWAGLGLSFVKRIPWVFELRDLWPESIKSVGILQDGVIYRILEKIELFLYKKADHIIPNSDAFKKNLISRGIPSEKISVIPNGSNLELFAPDTADPELIHLLGLQNKFVIGYFGTHGMSHALDFVVQSIAKLNNNQIHFLFIGNGSEKSKIVKLAESYKLRNITFLDSVPKQQMPKYLALIDVSLVSLKKHDTFKTVIPFKIFEAAAMGKPVLLGVDGEARKIIEEYQAGLFFKPENSDDLISKIRKLSNDKKTYEHLSKGGFRLAKAFNRKSLANEMLSILEKVAKPGPVHVNK